MLTVAATLQVNSTNCHCANNSFLIVFTANCTLKLNAAVLNLTTLNVERNKFNYYNRDAHKSAVTNV